MTAGGRGPSTPVENLHEDCNAWQSAAEEVDYRWHVFMRAKGPVDAGQALVDLANAMHDLRTWLPGYDYENGTLPWEREDEGKAGSATVGRDHDA
jgi:hypothetical protein